MDRSWTRYHGSEIVEQGKYDMSWEQVRRERNQALAASDWRAVKDRVLPNEWKEFRDLLRTLPQRFDDPNDAADNFPEAPDE